MLSGGSSLHLRPACAVARGLTPRHTDSTSPAACCAIPESLGCSAEQKRSAKWAPCPQHLTGPAWRSDCIAAAALPICARLLLQRGGYVNSTSSLAPTDICAANVSVSNAGQSSSGSSTSYIANLQASCNPAACNKRAACLCLRGSHAFWTPWAALADGLPTRLLEQPHPLTLPACFAVPCPFVEGLLTTHSWTAINNAFGGRVLSLGYPQGCLCSLLL